jgi:hypothetical protein
VAIGTANQWLKVIGGETHTLAIAADHSLWAWGNNSSGQLGNGTTTGALTPIQITPSCILSTEGFTGASKLKAVPNPTDNIVSINVQMDSNYIVYDLTGRKIGSGSLSPSKNVVDVGSFMPGNYIFHVKDSFGLVEVLKVVKQ